MLHVSTFYINFIAISVSVKGIILYIGTYEKKLLNSFFFF